MSLETDRMKKLLPLLDSVSPTVCLAKWYQTTIYLQTGETHSCYHPAPHKIPQENLEENPSSLHNTPHKKNERKEMLEGKQTAGCSYCWKIENLNKELISDRLLHSSQFIPSHLIYKRLQKVGEDNGEKFYAVRDGAWDQDVNPEYLELSFSNECHFKCGYCHPKASSRYMNEIKKFGPYTVVKNHRNDIDWFKAYEEDSNPYLDAFWKWWPSLKDDLRVLRITGGEPLLHKSTWKLLQSIKENPLPNLELNINTNLGTKTELVERLANEVTVLKNSGAIKRFKLYTSVDTWGDQAEYIRTGLDLELWERNLDTYLTITRSPIALMITFNILSVPRFQTLLEKILEWRKRYADKIEWVEHPHNRTIRFDTPYLLEPLQYDINLLPKDEFIPYMESHLAFMVNNNNEQDPTTFSDMEIEKFRRIVEYMRTTIYSEERLLEGWKDFGNWFDEYDRRRGTNFLATFPELENFYRMCKEIK